VVSGVLIQIACEVVLEPEVRVIVLFGFTVIDPIAVITPQPPVRVAV
jgi:hypothetical protein